MNGAWQVVDPGFTVLVVCTANICRSPLAERMLQEGFDDIAPGQFLVSSAGTHGLTGRGVEPRISEIAAGLGQSMSHFTARALTPELIHEADLILTMTREHRSYVVQMVPAALKRTFTIREFARILPHVPIERGAIPAQRWHSLVVLAQRHRRSPEALASDDVVDPFDSSDEIYEQMLAQLLPAVAALVDWERARSSTGS